MIVSSAYLMFAIFCPLIPFPSYSSSLIKVSEQMLNKHGEKIQPFRRKCITLTGMLLHYQARITLPGDLYYIIEQVQSPGYSSRSRSHYTSS